MKYLKRFENVLEGDVSNCFDHIENLRVVKMTSSSNVFNRIRLISKEKYWTNGYTTDVDLIDDILSGIGMAEELGFKFIEIRFESSTGGKDIEISRIDLLENPKGRLRKIKKFPVSSIIIDFGLDSKKKILENINSHYPGKYDTELKYCFDGFEDLNLHCQELTDTNKNKRGVILISKRHEKFTAVPFDINEDFIDEIESSFGKAGELGYTIKGIHLCELDNRENKSLFHDTSENSFTNFKEFSRYCLNKKSKNINGRTINSVVKAHNVLIYFNKPMVKENISLEPNIKNTFDHFEDQGFKVFKAELNVSNRTIEKDLPGFINHAFLSGNIHPLAQKSKVYLVGISNRSSLDITGHPPKEKVEITEDLIEDIESSIGMAKEIGYQFIKLELRFYPGDEINTEKILEIKDLYKQLDKKSDLIIVSFVKIT